MHWLKKSAFGMCLTFFLFIALNIFADGGISVVSPEFLGVGGLMLLLSMGAIEPNFVFYE